jgi:integrase
MSAAMNWAKTELEWDVSNPWQSRRQREPFGRGRWLTHEEASKLLQAAARTKRLQRYPWLRDFIRLGLYSGLRPGEMLWLEWRGSTSKVLSSPSRRPTEARQARRTASRAECR